jgi:hypothetical protein
VHVLALLCTLPFSATSVPAEEVVLEPLGYRALIPRAQPEPGIRAMAVTRLGLALLRQEPDGAGAELLRLDSGGAPLSRRGLEHTAGGPVEWTALEASRWHDRLLALRGTHPAGSAAFVREGTAVEAWWLGDEPEEDDRIAILAPPVHGVVARSPDELVFLGDCSLIATDVAGGERWTRRDRVSSAVSLVALQDGSVFLLDPQRYAALQRAEPEGELGPYRSLEPLLRTLELDGRLDAIASGPQGGFLLHGPAWSSWTESSRVLELCRSASRAAVRCQRSQSVATSTGTPGPSTRMACTSFGRTASWPARSSA